MNKNKEAYYCGVTLTHCEVALREAVIAYRVAQEKLVDCTTWLCHCGTVNDFAEKTLAVQKTFTHVQFERECYEKAFARAVELGMKKHRDMQLLQRNEVAATGNHLLGNGLGLQ